MLNVGTKSLPSIMQHSFSEVPQARIPRSQFTRNFEHKTTFDADYLIPFYSDEVYPGDTANMQFSAIVRLITPIAPFMDNLYLDFFFFFVPNRLVQNNWQKLMGEQDDPGDSIAFATPKQLAPVTLGYTTPTDWTTPTATQLSGALQDYWGIPPGADDLSHHNYLSRGYNLIYNEWFRDQNLQTSLVVDKDDGPDTPSDYVLKKRGKRHDYFTSCLTALQKGTAENLPIGTQAPVAALLTSATESSVQVLGVDKQLRTQNSNTDVYVSAITSTDNPLFADLTAATGATIGALYESFAIQELLQADARGGTRYIELINSHFGVTSPDFRLQRPEYLGGRSTPFMISPLPQTSQTATTELGTLAATGTATADGVGFIKSFVEHGYVIGIVNVRADLTYQQGLHRSFSRDTRYDFYFPAFANLSEQAVLNKEIYAQGTTGGTDDAATFGFQERWAELRYGRSLITGRMRSADAASLDLWHLSEDFSALPALNAAFIEQEAPIARVTAVTGEPHFKADFFGLGKWARPLPLYSVPGLQNRF